MIKNILALKKVMQRGNIVIDQDHGHHLHLKINNRSVFLYLTRLAEFATRSNHNTIDYFFN